LITLGFKQTTTVEKKHRFLCYGKRWAAEMKSK